jgi:hypothetical protein
MGFFTKPANSFFTFYAKTMSEVAALRGINLSSTQRRDSYLLRMLIKSRNRNSLTKLITSEKNKTGFTSNSIKLMLSWTKRIDETKHIILIIVAIGVILRLVSIPAFANAPHSPVDVYYVDNQVARFILEFKNPYAQPLTVHGSQSSLFAYLPMVAIYYAPFYLVGDIRFGSILADVLIMFSVYWIAKSINRGAAFFAPLAYAVLPFSIWLTSVASTNIMIGTSFFTLSIAFLFKKRYLVGAALFGVALATNQLVALALPLIIYYFWEKRKLPHFFVSLLVSSGIILPFIFSDPLRFVYDVLTFQFERPLQVDGPFSLYSVIFDITGQSLGSWLRIGLFLTAGLIALVLLARKTSFFVPLIGSVLLLGAFILPVNGFWNYFLPGAAFFCALLPFFINELALKLEKSDNSSEKTLDRTI